MIPSQDKARGMGDIIGKCLMEMQREWTRGNTWTNWKGEQFSADKEFLYVTRTVGHSKTEGGTGVGVRDEGHEDWDVQRFVEEVNRYIRERCKEMGKGEEEIVLILLTTEEVIAIRLYTGSGVWLCSFTRCCEFQYAHTQMSINFKF